MAREPIPGPAREIAAVIEREAERGQLDGLLDLAGKLEREIERLRDALRDYGPPAGAA